MSQPGPFPAVTAVIPAYNKELYIGRAIESALAQTYPQLQVIVVDDGSSDGTRAIAERFAAQDKRVRVVSVENGGVAAARNLGTQLAATPYVAYLDADDLWHPEKVARQIAALSAHGHEGEWAGCYTLSRFIDPADRVLGNGPCADARGDFFEPRPPAAQGLAAPPSMSRPAGRKPPPKGLASPAPCG